MKKLYVSNISFNANDNDLGEAFAPYGEVTEAKVIFDRDTNRSRGFGFVTFASAEEADAAISAMNDTDFMGRVLKVDVATDRPRHNNTGSFQGNRRQESRY